MSSPSPEQPSPRRVRRAIRDAASPALRAAWAFEERVVRGGAGAARSAAADAGWPFQRFAWAVQRRLIWPFQDAFGARSRPGRAALSLCLVAAAAAAGVAGAQIGTPGSQSSPDADPVTGLAASSAAVPTPAPRVESGPELKGAAPRFESAKATTADAKAGAGAKAATAPGSSTATASASAAPAAVNVVTQEVPAVALDTARRFAAAFVLYEVGKADAKVRATFRGTAAPSLVRSLAERPPRQPAQGEAPRARVLNVVAGPRYRRSASVSVSLLRLGETSELRLAMERTRGGWLVNDVRG